MFISHSHRAGLALASVAVAGTVLAGCTIPTDRDEPAGESTTASAAPVGPTQGNSAVSPTSAGAAPLIDSDSADLNDVVSAVEEDRSVELGVALQPISGSAAVKTAGSMATTPVVAWSTIKVPISIAALRLDSSDYVEQLVTAAITNSDNDATDQLWDMLGAPNEAAAEVEAVLAEAGDTATDISTDPAISQFSMYGQTLWALTEQVMFAQELVSGAFVDDPSAQFVAEEMTKIDPSQSYGLGRVPTAMFKGGWGPDEAGNYDARQFGVVAGSESPIAIAVTVKPADGSYESAQYALDDLAEELMKADIIG